MKPDFKDKTILFFDEVCELCSLFINWVSERDKKKVFLYAPLQGKTAKQYLELKDIQNLNSIVILKEKRLYREGKALKLILKSFYPYSSLFIRLMPAFLINTIYRFIAKRRYHWFGRVKDKTNYKQLKKSLLP